MKLKTPCFLCLIAFLGLFPFYLSSSEQKEIYKQKTALNVKFKNYTLYINPKCPYCIKVLKFMKRNNITLPIKNVESVKNKQELISIGGKSQVPCLVIDGKALYESNDIISYLETHFEK